MEFLVSILCLMVLGSTSAITANEAHISDKVLTKTQLVDFVNASLPDAEFESLAVRTLPHEFYSLGSSLVFSMLCDQRLEPERHQDSMHGCARLNEEFEKITVELKYRNRQMVIHSRSNAIVKTFTVQKTSVKPRFQSYKLVAQPSHGQNGGEFRGKPSDDSVNVSASVLLMQCCQDPVPTGTQNFPLSQPDEAIIDGFKLSTMKRASDFPCALESLFDAASFWPKEPEVKSPFFAPLPSYREEQAVLSEIPSEYGNFESGISENGYFGNLTKEQATPCLSTTSYREGIAPSADPSNSFTEYSSWKPLRNWSTKNLLFLLTVLITDMYNLLLKGQEVLSSSIVQPRLEEKSGPDKNDRNSYRPLSSLMLLLNI